MPRTVTIMNEEPGGSSVTAHQHDVLIDAYAHLTVTLHSAKPTHRALAAASGLPENLCTTWLQGGCIWPTPAPPTRQATVHDLSARGLYRTT